jgi:hypothetical protein
MCTFTKLSAVLEAWHLQMVDAIALQTLRHMSTHFVLEFLFLARGCFGGLKHHRRFESSPIFSCRKLCPFRCAKSTAFIKRIQPDLHVTAARNSATIHSQQLGTLPMFILQTRSRLRASTKQQRCLLAPQVTEQNVGTPVPSA